MKTRIAKLVLEIKDYQNSEKASSEFVGELVSADISLKNIIYRFFETDSGTLMVSIDYSSDVVTIQEKNDTIKLTLRLKLNEYQECIYHFDDNNYLKLSTKANQIEIDGENLILDYDLFNPQDLDHPLTRNIVKINCEVDK